MFAVRGYLEFGTTIIGGEPAGIWLVEEEMGFAVASAKSLLER